MATGKVNTIVVQILCARDKDTQKQGSVSVCLCVDLVGVPDLLVKIYGVIKAGPRTELLAGGKKEPDNKAELQAPPSQGRALRASWWRLSPAFKDAAATAAATSTAAGTVRFHVRGAGWEPRGPFRIKAQQSVLFSC